MSPTVRHEEEIAHMVVYSACLYSIFWDIDALQVSQSETRSRPAKWRKEAIDIAIYVRRKLDVCAAYKRRAQGKQRLIGEMSNQIARQRWNPPLAAVYHARYKPERLRPFRSTSNPIGTTTSLAR